MGSLEGIFQGFFLTHRTKAQKFRGTFRSIFRKKIRGSKKIFRAKFTLQTCHLKDFPWQNREQPRKGRTGSFPDLDAKICKITFVRVCSVCFGFFQRELRNIYHHHHRYPNSEEKVNLQRETLAPSTPWKCWNTGKTMSTSQFSGLSIASEKGT